VSAAGDKYFELEKKLLVVRAEEDKILEEMGDLWWEMTEEECKLANHHAALERLIRSWTGDRDE
jgi:hypothetical protein